MASSSEAEARKWLEELTGLELEGESLHEALKSGVVLCAAVNKIKPDTIPKVTDSKMPFKQMENIAAYLAAAANLGVPAHDSFMTVELFENKNMNAVVNNIHSLGRVAQTIVGYSGPTLGAKLATKSVREFSEEQLVQARAAPTFLNKGSHRTSLGS